MDMKSTLYAGVKMAKGKAAPDSTMKELIGKVFSSRNAFHFAHWSSKSYAEHEAIGGLYDGIVGKMDEIVEVYQGKYGLLQNVTAPASKTPKNLLQHVKNEAEWIGKNRDDITNNCEAASAIIDELEAMYLKAIYKLENLK